MSGRQRSAACSSCGHEACSCRVSSKTSTRCLGSMEEEDEDEDRPTCTPTRPTCRAEDAADGAQNGHLGGFSKKTAASGRPTRTPLDGLWSSAWPSRRGPSTTRIWGSSCGTRTGMVRRRPAFPSMDGAPSSDRRLARTLDMFGLSSSDRRDFVCHVSAQACVCVGRRV